MNSPTFQIGIGFFELFLAIGFRGRCLLLCRSDRDIILLRIHHWGHVPDKFSERKGVTINISHRFTIQQIKLYLHRFL